MELVLWSSLTVLGQFLGSELKHQSSTKVHCEPREVA